MSEDCDAAETIKDEVEEGTFSQPRRVKVQNWYTEREVFQAVYKVLRESRGFLKPRALAAAVVAHLRRKTAPPQFKLNDHAKA